MRNLQRLNVAQRRLVFFLIFGGVIFALIAGTWFLVSLTVGTGDRVKAVALVPGVTVREFASLPGDDAYPPAVAVAPDGTVYTGSYGSGALWSITSDGSAVTELPGTRDAIGAIAGLAVATDGSILVVDQEDTDPRSAGGIVWRVDNGTVNAFADIPDERGFIAPNDIALDAQGRVYVSDPGRNEVWRFEPDGSGGAVFWVPPSVETTARRAVTGLAYDPVRDALIITDPEVHEVYRMPIAGGASETIYRHGERPDAPGFDGVTVSPDGVIYIAALAQNGIAILNEDGGLDYIAGLFRGSSDVAWAAPNRLYVANFDQSSLVIPIVDPQLPFALDVIELSGNR
jgi:sugar lactone lactonase YvrE